MTERKASKMVRVAPRRRNMTQGLPAGVGGSSEPETEIPPRRPAGRDDQPVATD
jgi:hypothetical protein